MLDSLDSTGTLKIDGEGRLVELAPWSDQRAAAMAREEGLELTKEHLMLARALRTFYLRKGPLSAREVLYHLEDLVVDQGGKRYLYQLFPNGPVRQACHIAGLPIPDGSSNPSFGSVM